MQGIVKMVPHVPHALTGNINLTIIQPQQVVQIAQADILPTAHLVILHALQAAAHVLVVRLVHLVMQGIIRMVIHVLPAAAVNTNQTTVQPQQVVQIAQAVILQTVHHVQVLAIQDVMLVQELHQAHVHHVKQVIAKTVIHVLHVLTVLINQQTAQHLQAVPIQLP